MITLSAFVIAQQLYDQDPALDSCNHSTVSFFSCLVYRLKSSHIASCCGDIGLTYWFDIFLSSFRHHFFSCLEITLIFVPILRLCTSYSLAFVSTMSERMTITLTHIQYARRWPNFAYLRDAHVTPVS